VSNWRRRAARRTATMSLNGDVDQIQAELALIDVLLSPRETLWPVLRRQLRAPGGDGSLWQRLAHAAKMAARGGAAVLTRWC
jgi:hypothetical protein